VVSTIADWLKSLGMSEYAERFAENRIDLSVLRDLTDQDLRDLGIVLGDRRKMLRAIGELCSAGAARAQTVTAVPAARRESAERRQLTVMFCDLVGSTALSARLDPEDLRGIIGTYHRRCAEVIAESGGFVAKYLGDGVLAYFGYPRAKEDDAERAVRAGLALIEAVPKLDTAEGATLRVRVGIATGVVVVGDLLGEGAAQEQAVVGETPNLAARLQGLAEPDTVVVAQSTRKLLGNLFDIQDLGLQDLKGISGRVLAFVVLRPASVESRFDAMHGASLTTFVGREEESEILFRRWQHAKNREGQVLLLSGEPGIGKSRLTVALLERIAAEPHTRLRYFCSPQHMDSPLYSIIGHLERAARFEHGDDARSKLDKLDALLVQAEVSAEDCALLFELLSVPSATRYPDLELSPQQRRQKTLQALGKYFRALAREQPVLMIFEDVHWIDPSSLEALSLMIDNVRGMQVLLIVTFRPEFSPPWIGLSYVTMLTLNRLDHSEAATIIERIASGKPLSQTVMSEIIERTDGVPLFVEEMTKVVLESGETRAAHIASTVPSQSVGVPATLQASLMARLDRLGSAREIAQIGAAIGRQFSYELLAAVTGRQEHELAAPLDQLTDAGLLFRQGALPYATFLFKHALVQDVAYSTLLRGSRKNLHGRIAVALEQHFPEIVLGRPETLAQHYAQAGVIDKAVTSWLKAGQQAMARSAMTEAVAQLRKGLDLLSQLPEGVQRQQHELDLQVTIGQALMATRGFAAPEVGEACTRARQLCDQLNRPLFVPMLVGEWNHHFLRAELDRAHQGAEEILNLGEERNEVTLKVVGHRTLGLARFALGDFAGSRASLERAAALYDPAHLANYTTHHPSDPYIIVHVWLSRTLGWLGYLDQARTQMERLLAEARRLGHAFTITHTLVEICIAEWGMRAPEALLARADELVSLAAAQFTMFEPQGMMIRGWCLTALGQEDGAALAKRGLAAFRATGSKLLVPFYLTLLADACGKAGKPEEGLACLYDAARLVEVTHEHSTDAEIHRIRGELLILLRDIPAATAALRTSVEISRRQQSRLFELRAAASLARLWRDQGKRTEARDVLAPIYGWFTEGFDAPVLKEAKLLLEQLKA